MATKKILHSFCVYCNQPVSSDQAGVEYVKTKQRKEILFHNECYKRHAVIRHVAAGLEEYKDDETKD